MARPLVGWLLAAFAAAILALAWAEVFVTQAAFGLAFGPHGSDAVVLRVTPGSYASRLGLQPGDVVLISRISLSDRCRLEVGYSPAGTPVVVPVIHRGVRRIVELRATMLPDTRLAHSQVLILRIEFLANATITLLIVGMIAFLRPSLASAALVWYGAGSIMTAAVAGLFSWIPNPWYGAVTVAIVAAFSMLPLLALLPFIVRFPESPSTPEAELRMNIADLIFVLGAIALTVQTIFEPIVFQSWAAFDTWCPLAFAAVVLVFAALAYYDSSGESRQRIGWVIFGFALSALGYAVFNIFIDNASQSGTLTWLPSLTGVLQCALPVALAYAILRHRVLDIGFAVNRTVVYAVMTTLVVGVVSLADWVTARLLSHQQLAMAVEALITISFGFGLNWIHGRIERLIDRVVFRQRHIAEKRIEYRIGALGFAASSAAVDDALAVDAPHILDLSSAAVFTRLSPTSPFRRMASIEWPEATASTVDADEILVRTLRSLERPVFLDDVAIEADTFPRGFLRPVLAVPVVAQHELIGFALYGNHRDGVPPDPEELSLLARLAQAAGNAYGAVEARQWRERAVALEESLRGIATPSLTG